MKKAGHFFFGPGNCPGRTTMSRTSVCRQTGARLSAGRRRCRILIVDDMAAVCVAVTNWLNRFPDLHVCGHAGSEETALTKITALHPGLVLSEMLRPKECGFIQELHRRHPRLPILVFSHRDEEAYAPLALEAGACGYLMKGVDGDMLVAGIRDALKGRVVLSRAMAARLRRDGNFQGSAPKRFAQAAPPPPESLSADS
jgi:DNA-binding NarL/FixJ family response regulator